MKKEKKILIFNIMAIILIAIFCISIAPKTLQNDTFYTVSIGEHIMKNGVDMQDPFSWHELPYTYPHWAYDVMMYYIFILFGLDGVYVSTCIFSAILGITLYGVNCKLAKNHIVSFIITLISMYLIKDYIAARAQLITFILFVLTVYFIEMFLETKKKRYAFGLVIIPIIIANMHVAVWPFYFILYLPYIGEYIIALVTDFIMDRKITRKIISTKIEKLSKKEGNEEKVSKLQIKYSKLNAKIEKAKENRIEAKKNPYKIKINKNSATKWLICIMLVCILSGLLTPLGDTPYTYLIKTVQGNTTKNINEHLPMTLIDHQYLLCLILVYLVTLTFTEAKIKLSDLFMLAGLSFLMLKTRRQASMFLLIGSVIINKLLLEVMEMHIEEKIEEKILTHITKVIWIGIISSFMIGISLQLYSQQIDKTYIDESSYPVKACDYILENIDLSKAKFYNDYNYGSYMLFRGIPVFIDSRADLYAPEFNTPTGNPKDGKDIFMDFMNVSNIGTYYDSVYKDYGITHVITPKNSKIAMLITNRTDKKYKELYSDDHFIIFEIQKEEQK